MTHTQNKKRYTLILLGLISLNFPSFNFAEESTSIASSSAKENTALMGIKPYHANYILKWNKYKLKIKAQRSLSLDQGEGELQLSASAFIANMKQQTTFSYERCQIEPNEYLFKRFVLGKTKKDHIEFNATAGTLKETRHKKTKNINYTPPLFDELSYQLALRCDLKKTLGASSLEENKGKRFQYQVRTKGQNKNYTFEIIGEETLKTPMGKIQTVKLSRIRSARKSGSEHRTLIWFAAELDYLMVQFEQHDKDDLFSLKLGKVTFD